MKVEVEAGREILWHGNYFAPQVLGWERLGKTTQRRPATLQIAGYYITAEDVAELRKRLKRWLKTGSLKLKGEE